MVEMLRIGIDGYNLALPHGTGVATYGHALADTLHRAGHRIEGIYGLEAGSDPSLRETLFFDALGRPLALSIEQRRRAAQRRLIKALHPLLTVTAADVPLTDRVDRAPLADRLPPFDRIVTSHELFVLAHRHFGLYGRFLRLRMPDPPPIMHWTYPLPIELDGARNIYTLHDIVPLRLPFTTLDRKVHYRALLAKCIARSAAICTVSEASKADIVREFQIDPMRIVNTYQASPLPAASLAASAEEDARVVEGAFGLPRDGYFLFLGAIEPKKNVGRLIEAFLSQPIEAPLVIVGGRGWQSEGELSLLSSGDGRPDANPRIRMLPRLSRPLLMRLIRGARAVLFPSLSEGFGLPVLEAMQLGTPVLTADRSSLPEIAGGAALLVNPYDIGAIAAAITALDRDRELREHLSAAGLVRSTAFAADRYTERLETLYRHVLDGTPPAA